MNPIHRDTDRFSRLASVSRALDFGSAARARAIAPLEPRRNKAHASAPPPPANPPGILAQRNCAMNIVRIMSINTYSFNAVNVGLQHS
jgi:hypothetical protein